MIKTIKELEEYLENYEHTMSNQMDSVFPLFKSDVSSLAKDYAKGDVYIYTKVDYIEYLTETEQFDKLEEVEESVCTMFIEKTGVDDFYSI